jgi:hypothetical protein
MNADEFARRVRGVENRQNRLRRAIETALDSMGRPNNPLLSAAAEEARTELQADRPLTESDRLAVMFRWRR